VNRSDRSAATDCWSAVTEKMSRREAQLPVRRGLSSRDAEAATETRSIKDIPVSIYHVCLSVGVCTFYDEWLFVTKLIQK